MAQDLKDELREVERGRSEATPFVLLGGTTVIVAVVVLIVCLIALLAYFLAK
jgi:hypothetical protein